MQPGKERAADSVALWLAMKVVHPEAVPSHWVSTTTVSPVPSWSPHPWQPQVVLEPLMETEFKMQQPLQHAASPEPPAWRLQDEAPQQLLLPAWLPSSQTWS